MRLLFLPVLLCFSLFTAAQAANLSERDRTDVAAVEDYLNSFATLKAHFLQVSEDGNQAEGSAYLSRPGRMRLPYDPPAQLVLVADGTFLIVDDQRLPNPSYVLLSSTPAGVLVRDKINLLHGDLAVTKVKHQTGVIAVSLTDAKDPDQGELTLVFNDKPIQLRQWQIIDSQNKLTTVSLFDVQTGIPVDKKLFNYQKGGMDSAMPH